MVFCSALIISMLLMGMYSFAVANTNLYSLPDNALSEINYWNYISIDTNVYRSSPSSVRLDADYVRGTRECNLYPRYGVDPGDHIYFGCWIRTSNDVYDTPYTGGRVGIDLVVDFGGYYEGIRWSTADAQPHNYVWNGTHYISGNLPSWHYTGTAPETYLGNPATSQFKVPFSNTVWTWVYFDLIIPDCYYHYNEQGWLNYTALTGNSVGYQISSIAPWFDAREIHDGTVWCDDVILYINPTTTPTPTPSPTPTPTPSPTPTPTPTPSPTPTPITTPRGVFHTTYAPLMGLSAGGIPTNDPLVSGSGFVIYTDTGLGFQSGSGTQLIGIEVLTGTWGGENCKLGLTGRGGNLYFESNETCEFQLTNYHSEKIRLDYEGFGLSVINPGFSWNGSFPNDGTDCLIHWSWPFTLPHEDNWNILMGILGIALLLIGLLLMAYLIKTYPLFSFSKEILFDKLSFVISIVMIIIGAGFIIIWLMA